MRAVFLDASLWLEALSPKMARHEKAKVELAQAVRQQLTVVTTSLVVAEVHAMVVRRMGPGVGRRLLDEALGAGFHVVYPDANLFQDALERWVRRFSDQAFSICDAVSFALMSREGMTRALAFDRHFATAGFEIVS